MNDKQVNIAVEKLTKRKESDEASSQSQIPYRLLFDSNPIAMWVLDLATFRFFAVNTAATSRYGFSKEEFLGMSLVDIQPDAHITDLLESVAKLRPGLHNPGIRKHRKKDGSILDVEIACHDLDFHGSRAMLCAIYDVTERQRSREILRDSESKYRALFEHSPDACWLMDESGFLDSNSAALKMFGFSDKAEFTDPAAISPPTQPNGMPSRIAAGHKIASALLKGSERFEWFHKRADEEVFPAEVSLSSLTLNGQQLLLASVRDITERKHSEEALLLKNALLEAESETTLDGILAVDEQDRIILINRQFVIQFEVPDHILKSGDDLLLKKHTLDRIDNPEAFIEKIEYLYEHVNEKSWDEIRLKNGRVFDRYSAPLFDSRGKYRGRIWYHRDITARRAAEAQVQFLAYYDALTGLPNRTLLKDRLQNALSDARRRKEKVAVLFLDLDRFKIINDSLGHSIGDQLLKAVAERLKECIRDHDTVSRVGGDEFVFVLSGVKDTTDITVIADRIVNAVTRRFSIAGHSLSVGCSLGISTFPENGADGETLIKYADQAMYCAKKDRRNTFRFFTKDLHRAVLDRLKLESHMHQALQNGEFYLEYQPQVEISSGRITGIEALIRWKNHKLGQVPPNEFIAIAENNGLILTIGQWVLETACSQVRKWQLDGLNIVPVAVNVSAVQFGQDGFTEQIRDILITTGLSAEFLELELTESALLSNADITSSVLKNLGQMGVSLAIDDFGMGYSSLRYLKQFRANCLKIDRSFIQDLEPNNDDAAIISAIIGMAKTLHIKVVAEGVENELQMSFLRNRGCDEFQGYYFSKPLSAEDMAKLLHTTMNADPFVSMMQPVHAISVA